MGPILSLNGPSDQPGTVQKRVRAVDRVIRSAILLLRNTPGIGSVYVRALLVIKAKAGDAAALEAILQRCLPQLARWAHGRLPPTARGHLDTCDLVQDAAFQVIRRIDFFEPRHVGAMQAFLRRRPANGSTTGSAAFEDVGTRWPCRDQSSRHRRRNGDSG